MDDTQFVFRIHSADGIVVAGDQTRHEAQRLEPGTGRLDYIDPDAAIAARQLPRVG